GQRVKRSLARRASGERSVPRWRVGLTTPAPGPRLLCQHAVDKLRQLLLGGEADDALLGLVAAAEEEDLRDAGDPIANGRVLVVVGVEIADLQLADVLLGQAVYGRGQGAAWPAPRRPEVDQDWLIALDHLFFPVFRRELHH